MRTKSRTVLGGLTVLLFGQTALLAQSTQSFGAATFVAPSGWSAQSQPEVLVFSRELSGGRCLLLVSAEVPSQPTLDAGFAAAWREVSSGPFRSAGPPATAERTSPTGARFAFGEGDLEDGSGQRLRARLHVFPLGKTSQWIALLGNGGQALASCEDDWSGFFRSLRFRTAAVVQDNPEVVTAETPQQFENITFVPPRGWNARRADGLVELSPSSTRGPERLGVLLLSGRPAGSLEGEIATTWNEIRALLNAEQLRNVSGRSYDLDQTAQTLLGVEYLRGNGGMRNAGGEWDVSVYAFRAGERIERAVVLAKAFTENLSRMTTANNPQFARDIRRLLFRMQFANVPPRPLAPAGLKPGGIVGVWAGLGMSMGSIKPQLVVFFDNGMAYFGPTFPTQGLHQIDAVVEQPTHRRYWGTYTWSGGAGVLTMPYGTVPLRSTGTGIELTTNQTPHRYIKLALPLNARLDGTWCYETSCLRFTPEGRFEDGGAVRIAEHSLYAWPQAPASGAGTYRLRDHTLYLDYDGGPELKVGFPGIEDGRTSSPTTLWLGWNMDLIRRR